MNLVNLGELSEPCKHPLLPTRPVKRLPSRREMATRQGCLLCDH